jgi:hypothetical protein
VVRRARRLHAARPLQQRAARRQAAGGHGVLPLRQGPAQRPQAQLLAQHEVLAPQQLHLAAQHRDLPLGRVVLQQQQQQPAGRGVMSGRGGARTGGAAAGAARGPARPRPPPGPAPTCTVGLLWMFLARVA